MKLNPNANTVFVVLPRSMAPDAVIKAAAAMPPAYKSPDKGLAKARFAGLSKTQQRKKALWAVQGAKAGIIA